MMHQSDAVYFQSFTAKISSTQLRLGRLGSGSPPDSHRTGTL